jgi:hypothetical protein
MAERFPSPEDYLPQTETASCDEILKAIGPRSLGFAVKASGIEKGASGWFKGSDAQPDRSA